MTPALKHILFVDDDPDMHNLALVVLGEMGGFTLSHAYDGDQALAMITHRQPDLLLLDLLMPHMDGLVLLGMIRADQKLSSLPVVIMTGGNAEPSTLAQCRQLGALGILNKSDDPLTLSDRLNQLWEKQHDPLA